MAGLRERVLEFLRDDYCAHRGQPMASQLGDYKWEEHQQAFRVRLKQLMAEGNGLEAQRWLVFHGYLRPQPPLEPQPLRREVEAALAATPDGTAARRRGNLCERIMECALDVAMGPAALGSPEERQARRALAEADYAKQSAPAWPPLTLEGEGYQRVVGCLVGAEAEAWFYDAGYPVAEVARRARQLEAEEEEAVAAYASGASRTAPANARGTAGGASPAAAPAASGAQSAPAIVAAAPKPRLKDIPLALVERYHAMASAAPSAAAPAAAVPGSEEDLDALQAQIVQLWKALEGKPSDYSDVLVPLALDNRSGAGLYLMGIDLLEGAENQPLSAWCGPDTWARFGKLQRRLPFLFVIMRRSDDPVFGNEHGALLPLLRKRLGVGDTRLEDVSIEVLPPSRSVALMVANALVAFRDVCTAEPQYNTSLDYYRATNGAAPANCPERFRPLFPAGEDF